MRESKQLASSRRVETGETAPLKRDQARAVKGAEIEGLASNNFSVFRSPSLTHLFVLSTLFETWERLPMFGEP